MDEQNNTGVEAIQIEEVPPPEEIAEANEVASTEEGTVQEDPNLPALIVENALAVLPHRQLPWAVRVFVFITGIVGSVSMYGWISELLAISSLFGMELPSFLVAYAAIPIKVGFAFGAAAATIYAISPDFFSSMRFRLRMWRHMREKRFILRALKIFSRYLPNHGSMFDLLRSAFKDLQARHERDGRKQELRRKAEHLRAFAKAFLAAKNAFLALIQEDEIYDEALMRSTKALEEQHREAVAQLRAKGIGSTFEDEWDDALSEATQRALPPEPKDVETKTS